MKTFIFDLDGTLLNTLEDIANACNRMLQNHVMPCHPVDCYKNMVGDGFPRLVERALPQTIKIDLSPEKFKNFISEAREFYSSGMMDNTLPYPDIQKTLRDLIKNHVSLAILSNKPDELTRKLAQHYFPDINFIFVRGAINPFPPKPDTTLLSKLLESYNIHNPIYYIGDSKVDIMLAKKLGIFSVGVSWGFRGVEELVKEKADYIIESPRDLLNI